MGEQNGWQLKGDAPEAYEKYIAPTFSGAWARDLVMRASIKPGERVLDLACGTGIVARRAIEFAGAEGNVAGVDVNETMLKKAREIAPQAIEWKQGEASAIPFPDAVFDAVLCQQGLQYFTDRNAALREIRRVLAPKGRFVASLWRPIKYFPFYVALHDALEQYVSAEDANTLSSAFTLGDMNLLRELFQNAGFGDVNIRLVIKQMRYPSVQDFFYGGLAASPFAEAVLAMNASKRNAMFQEVETALTDYIDDGGLAAPMECYVVSVRK